MFQFIGLVGRYKGNLTLHTCIVQKGKSVLIAIPDYCGIFLWYYTWTQQVAVLWANGLEGKDMIWMGAEVHSFQDRNASSVSRSEEKIE